MSSILLKAIEAQAKQEHSSRSGFMTSIMTFLLLSSNGQNIRENAKHNNRTLAQELEQSLSLFQQQIPQEQIEQLAAISQRSPTQMLTYLVLLGLNVYQEEKRLNQKAQP